MNKISVILSLMAAVSLGVTSPSYAAVSQETLGARVSKALGFSSDNSKKAKVAKVVSVPHNVNNPLDETNEDENEDELLRNFSKKERAENKLVGNGPGTKKPMTLKVADTELTIGGKLREEYNFTRNAVFLNKNLPDEFGYFKNTFDLFTHIGWGKQKYGHKAVEFKGALRHKSLWGMAGASGITDKQSVKLQESLVGEHSHSSDRPLMWVKEVWLQASLSALVGKGQVEQENIHAVRLGMFPFQLGRGIALGNGYGTKKDFLVAYDTINDFYAPAILVTGPIVKNKLYYDAYYAKYQEQSSSPKQNFSLVNLNRPDRKNSAPWLGCGKDDELWAFQIRWTALDDLQNGGQLQFDPYIFYNEASAKKVELPADAKSSLGTFGITGEYAVKNFKVSGEIAANFGHELLYPIDRNQVKLQRNGITGDLQEVYSHVVAANLIAAVGASPAIEIGEKIPVTTAYKANLDANTNNNNSTNVAGTGIFTSNADLKNATNRFRPQFQDEYRGWMAVLDVSYNFVEEGVKIAAAYGFASGDKNPHRDEVNGTYRGWIGLNELYNGKEVTSIFILDSRVTQRPMTLRAGEDAAERNQQEDLTDGSFSDLHYVGCGFTYVPRTWFKNPLYINPNIIFFFKDHVSPAWDQSLNNGAGAASTIQKASSFLGTEWNIQSKYELLADLNITAVFAMFIPGLYYQDIKGTKLKDDIAEKFAALTSTDIARFRLSNDIAYGLNVGLEYKF